MASIPKLRPTAGSLLSGDRQGAKPSARFAPASVLMLGVATKVCLPSFAAGFFRTEHFAKGALKRGIETLQNLELFHRRLVIASSSPFPPIRTRSSGSIHGASERSANGPQLVGRKQKKRTSI